MTSSDSSFDSTFDSREFRRALGAFTTGVTIVTTRGPAGNDCGLTANSFNSVSMDPPLVLWSLDKTSTSLDAFSGAGHFAVHILAADQESTSNRFARSGVDKFEGMDLARGHGDVPLLDGCSARFECRVAYRYDGGDHIIFVGEVVAFDTFHRPPLIFHGGNYGLLLKKSDEAAGAGAGIGNDWLGFLLGRAFYQLLMPIKKSLGEHGLRDLDYTILTVLSMGEGRTIDDLGKLVAMTGYQMGEADIAELIERDLVSVVSTDGGGEAVVCFTDDGRRYAMELLAFGKSAEGDAVRDLDHREAQVLKMLLRRVIGSTAGGLPDCWRKDRFWRDDNIWREEIAVAEGSS
ncbi:flavin reductase [Lysobacter sp. TAF61]|uniref:flavin reductase n=1 Tax=Lysobacter sp. TAF61 TaxID=3233072 RepID=UPI003F97E82D